MDRGSVSACSRTAPAAQQGGDPISLTNRRASPRQHSRQDPVLCCARNSVPGRDTPDRGGRLGVKDSWGDRLKPEDVPDTHAADEK